jgi:hypothetical protein
MKNNSLHAPRLSVLCALWAAVFAFVTASSALAQDWRFEPIFKVGGEFDDNATLDPRTDQEVDLSGILLDARANIKYASPATSFLAQPRVVSRNYDDDAVFDSDDFFLRSNFRRRATKSTVGFRVNFEQQSVRTGERADSDLEIEDPDELTNDDTGRVLRFGDRTKWRLSPYWQYQLSNVSSIGAQFDFLDTQYDDVFAGLLADYSDTRLVLNFRRTFSDVTSWGISLTGRRYDSDDLPEEIDGYGLSAVIEHALSEKTRIGATIGFEDTDESDSDTDPEVVGSVTLTRKLETIRLFARYQRSVSGGGAGSVSVRDSFDVNFRRRLNEKISAGLGVRAYQTKNVSGSTSIEDRNYVQLHSSLVWYLTRSFVIEANYRYTVIDRDEFLGERANSNQINLWFTYQPKTTPKI